ncbi:MAG: branched-chain amino acid ABC transporter permease, partial [Vulcanimicrobiaceae bacterium]
MIHSGRAIGTVVTALVLLALPWLLPKFGLNVSLGTQIVLYALAAASVNVLLGYTGLMTFGNAAFFGVGAYGSALFAQDVAPNLLLALAVGAVAGLLSAVIIGPFLIRRRGIYFALLTIAFGQVYYFIAYRWNSVTGGEDGMTIVRPPLFGHPLSETQFYLLSLLVFALFMSALWVVVHSPFGLTLRAISQNEQRVRYLGLNSDRFILFALAISGLLAGTAGSLYSMSINFAFPLLLDWHQSGDFVMMVVLGGSGTLLGPLLGAAIYALGQNVLSTYTSAWQIYIGGLFVFCVIAFPRGILGIRFGARD